MQIRQDHNEPFWTFAAQVRGKAETCSYHLKCSCNNTIDKIDEIIRDVLVAGIYNTDIRGEILGTDNILEMPINLVVSLVEGKEMARNAMPMASASISLFQHQKNPAITSSYHPRKKTEAVPCPQCGAAYHLFSENCKGTLNSNRHQMCIECYRSSRGKNREAGKTKDNSEISGMFVQVSSIQTPTAHTELRHWIFSKGQWRRSRFLDHPKLHLKLSIAASDYKVIGRMCHNVNPVTISAMADTGAQSCLWSMDAFLAAGFLLSDLIPVKIDLVAANKSPIRIEGAIVARLSADGANGITHSCATMVYVSRQAKGMYISMENMMDLAIIPRNFPNVGAETQSTPFTTSQQNEESATPVNRIINAGCSSIHDGTSDDPCDSRGSCPQHTVVPE